MGLTLSEDRKTADVDLAPETIRLVAMVPQDLYGDYSLPVFEAQKCATHISMPTGRPALVSTFSPPTNTGVPGGNKDDRVCGFCLSP